MQTHPPLCLHHKIISFSICHTITVYWPLPWCFSPGNHFLGSRHRDIAPAARRCKSTIVQLDFSHSKLRIQIRMCGEHLGEGAPPWQPRWLDHQRRQLDVVTVISTVTNQLQRIPALKAYLHTLYITSDGHSLVQTGTWLVPSNFIAKNRLAAKSLRVYQGSRSNGLFLTKHRLLPHYFS